MTINTNKAALLAAAAGLGIIAAAAGPARAAVNFTDTTNITVANQQVESGGDTTDNPLVVNGPTGPAITYTTASQNGYCCGATFAEQNYDDNDVGTGVPSDGFYALPNNGAVTLTFAAPTTVGSIAIYNGYGNRTDGGYVLTDGSGNTLGAWTISGVAGATNDGVDSFWLTLNTPVTTGSLVLTATGVEENTPSYREIDIFAPVPEPSAALLAGGAGLLGLLARRRRRTA